MKYIHAAEGVVSHKSPPDFINNMIKLIKLLLKRPDTRFSRELLNIALKRALEERMYGK